ncbi:hypothetical protein V1294_006826 [Bradyrhizobium sp. AZCC 1678]
MRSNEIEERWQKVEKRTEIPEGRGTALEGSIAECWGNPGSDFDFVVMTRVELRVSRRRLGSLPDALT